RHVRRDIEALHLAGDLAGEARGVEALDPDNARLARQGIAPGLRDRIADRADDAQTSDNDSAARHLESPARVAGRKVCFTESVSQGLACALTKSMACWTVVIFSASSSGISVSNSSSSAITSSTVSSESAPRSSTNDDSVL